MSKQSRLGRAGYIAQVWVLPAVALDSPLTVPGPFGFTLKSVGVKPPQGDNFLATLLQMAGTGEDMLAGVDAAMRRLGTVLSRLSFSLQVPFTVYCARLIQEGVKPGGSYQAVLFPGAPPGIALSETKLGFRRTVELDLSLAAGELQPDVEGAITWFLRGLFAEDSIQQVVYHWIGLEMLAPETRGPWRCSGCGREVLKCAKCGRRTEEPKAVRTIRNFLTNELGVDRAEFEALYDLRNKIIHGGLAMDPDGVQAAADKAFRIEQLLLLAIKKALKWPLDKPPVVNPEGVAIIGVPALAVSGTVEGSDFYDSPGIFPAPSGVWAAPS